VAHSRCVIYIAGLHLWMIVACRSALYSLPKDATPCQILDRISLAARSFYTTSAKTYPVAVCGFSEKSDSQL